MKPFPTSAACCFGILFISVSLITTGSSEVQVVGSADPVVALAGDDVILPCSLKPRVSAEDMVVKWTGLFLETRNVHLYLDGRDSNEEQHPSYRTRTSMFKEELKNGNISLKLTRVTLSDAGSYQCFIPTLTSQVKETTVQLFVGAVSQPVISIDGTKGWGLVLKCESGGWYPEPEMVWLDSSGSILPADGPPERHWGKEGLYTVRQHVTVDKTDTNRFTCIVQQPEINHKKETEIHVPDLKFPKSQLIFGLLTAAVVVVVLAASAVGLYKWRKRIEEKMRVAVGKQLEEHVKDFKLAQDKRRDAQFVDMNRFHLIQNVTMVIPIAFYLIRSAMYSEIRAARTRQDQMRLLYVSLDSESRRKKRKSDFYRILLDLEPDVVINLGAKFVDGHKDQLIQNCTMVVKPIMYELFHEEMYCNIKIRQMTSWEQMSFLFQALEKEDTRKKLDFYWILLDLQPVLVKLLGSDEDYLYLFELQNLIGELEVIKQKDSDEDYLYLFELQNLIGQLEEVIKQKGSDEDYLYLYVLIQNLVELLELRLENGSDEDYLYLYDLIQNLSRRMGGARFVDMNRFPLIQNVTMVIPIAFYLIHSELYSEIRAARTRQDQMRLLYEALDSGGEKLKSDFFTILHDLQPDLVKLLAQLRKQNAHLRSESAPPRMQNAPPRMQNAPPRMQNAPPRMQNDPVRRLMDPFRKENARAIRERDERIQNLSGRLDEVTRERDELRKRTRQLDPFRKENAMMKSLSEESERIEEMEMETLLDPGQQKDDLDEMERGGRV